MNMSVSNFMSSTRMLSAKLAVVARHEADSSGHVDDDDCMSRQDIGRCASMPNIKHEFLQEARELAS